MTENEVNAVCQKWIEANGYKYKGVLNCRPSRAKERNGKDVGWGQVPVPDGLGQVLIDHQGVLDKDKSIIWIEAKGEDDAFSELLQGFIRVLYACYYGGGSGLLAVPDNEYCKLIERKEFLINIAKASEKRIGLFNAESEEIIWFDNG